MTKDEATGLFVAAGFKVLKVQELPNGYWPDAYEDLRKANPWWFIKTEFGWIKIGWRKRVIQIDWEDTGMEVNVTADDVTKEWGLVHAWTLPKALEYLMFLKCCFIDIKNDKEVKIPQPVLN